MSSSQRTSQSPGNAASQRDSGGMHSFKQALAPLPLPCAPVLIHHCRPLQAPGPPFKSQLANLPTSGARRRPLSFLLLSASDQPWPNPTLSPAQSPGPSLRPP